MTTLTPQPWWESIDPAWTLRIHLGSKRLSGYLAPRVHLFDGVSTACEQFRTLSIFRHPALTFHSPTTVPTCTTCRRNHRRSHQNVGPAVLADARARMVAHTIATRDPHVAAVTLRMLSAVPDVEPVARLLSVAASPIVFEGPTP